MKNVLKKVLRVWGNIDHKYRSFSLVLGVLVCSVVIYVILANLIVNKISNSDLRDQGKVVSELVANDLRRKSEGPKSSLHISDYLKLKYVDDVVVLDLKGNILFPLSLKRNEFQGDNSFIKDQKENFSFADGYGYFIRPIYTASGYSKKIIGYVYLRLQKDSTLISVLTFMALLLTVVAVLSLAVSLRGELISSINRVLTKGKGFNQLGRLISEKVKREINRLSSMYEHDLRMFVKYSSDSLVLLNDKMSIIELSRSFFEKFCNCEKYSEGRHVIDVLNDESDSKFLINSLNALEVQENKVIQNDRCFIQFNRLRFPSSSYQFSVRIIEKTKKGCR